MGARHGGAGVLLLLAAVTTGCVTDLFDDRSNDVEARESFFYRLDAEGRSRVWIENVNGGITITGEASTTEVVIEGHRVVRSDSRADAEAFLARVTVEVTEPGTEIRARTTQPDDTDGRDVSVAYEVTMPPGLALYASTINGGIDVRGTEGDAEVRAVNGGLAGTLSVPAGGEIVFSTVNGGILLSIPAETSAMLEADVVNGAISLQGITLTDPVSTSRSVRGQLGSGDGLLRLTTTNGGIAVTAR